MRMNFCACHRKKKSIFSLSRIEQKLKYVHSTDPAWLQTRIQSKP
jgi:hypothetical protein